jgi:Mn2+/Fe2+ NRAMP family transporter
MFGRSTSKIYGLALLASGQSNTMTTSYSGQYIMQVIYNNGWIQGVSVPCIVHIKIHLHLPYIILILILCIYQEKIRKKK